MIKASEEGLRTLKIKTQLIYYIQDYTLMKRD